MRKLGGDLVDAKQQHEQTCVNNAAAKKMMIFIPWCFSKSGIDVYISSYSNTFQIKRIAFQLQKNGFFYVLRVRHICFTFKQSHGFAKKRPPNFFSPRFQLWHSSFATVTGDMTSSTAMPLSLSRADFGEIAPRHRVPCTSCVLQES